MKHSHYKQDQKCGTRPDDYWKAGSNDLSGANSSGGQLSAEPKHLAHAGNSGAALAFAVNGVRFTVWSAWCPDDHGIHVAVAVSPALPDFKIKQYTFSAYF